MGFFFTLFFCLFLQLCSFIYLFIRCLAHIFCDGAEVRNPVLRSTRGGACRSRTFVARGPGRCPRPAWPCPLRRRRFAALHGPPSRPESSRAAGQSSCHGVAGACPLFGALLHPTLLFRFSFFFDAHIDVDDIRMLLLL